MNTRQTLEALKRYESRNVTYMAKDGSWPIVWTRARGVWVWDAEGKRYLDLTAAFGVAAAGHANLAVTRAACSQMKRLLHAMGDVHPHPKKAELARELSRVTFERWGADRKLTTAKTIFCNSGFEAVEAALKTAVLATGKDKIMAFEGAYHGLGYGALNATHREHFRSPFRKQLKDFGFFLPFPETSGRGGMMVLRQVEKLLRSSEVGAVIVEPIQARGGIRIPEDGFLEGLSRLCTKHGVLLILDEIYTGFGRTGRWFACEHEKVIPDIVCLGKALTGGFPLSACVGRADLMDAAWPASDGEAIHTSTYLGHPVGCAMALAQLKELASKKLVEKCAEIGANLLARLEEALRPLATRDLGMRVRGRGLLVGVEFTLQGKPATEICLKLITELLGQGFIFLPEGEHSNVLSFTPPLTITESQLGRAVDALTRQLKRQL